MESVAYIISGIQKALAFEWIAEAWDWNGSRLSFILLNPGPSPFEEWLRQKQLPVYRVSYQGKGDLPRAIRQVYHLLKQHKVSVVHCHLFDASLAGLLAARLAGVKKRIYTRHYATFHQVYFPRAVYYDKFINFLASDIVAISQNVSGALLKEGVSSRKIHLIHHGFKLDEFTEVPGKRVAQLREKYGLTGKGPVIGVISRYFELKGIQYIIPAFERLLSDFENAHLVLANATGEYAPTVRALLSNLPAGSYTEISFEGDVAALYQAFDVFVHVPINEHIEAFGQTYVEALAAEVPSVFTLSGIAPEFIEPEGNALVVPFRDDEAIYQSISRLLQDQALRKQLTTQGRADVQRQFTLETMIGRLAELYAR